MAAPYFFIVFYHSLDASAESVHNRGRLLSLTSSGLGLASVPLLALAVVPLLILAVVPSLLLPSALLLSLSSFAHLVW